MVLGGPKSSDVKRQIEFSVDCAPASRQPLRSDTAKPTGKGDEEEDSWKQYLRIILPHCGLVILCVLYTLAGATVFYYLERPNEEWQRERGMRRIQETKDELLNNLWTSSQLLSYQEWKEEAGLEVENMTRVLFEAFDDRFITIKNLVANTTPTHLWTFPTAIFFAATTITTVGYGNLVPVTQWGRVFCVAFGLFGIPLMLVTIADIGKFIGDGIVSLYHKYRLLHRSLRRWRLRDEIRQKDFVVKSQPHSVPVMWVCLIIVGYTALGGAVIPCWEDWNFYESFYFSFVTMSTIGFGDYVPKNQSFYLLTILYILLGLAISTMCVDLVGSEYIQKIHYFGRKFKNAKEAFKTVGDLLRYTTFLRRRYNLNPDELKQLRVGTDWAEFLLTPAAFTPKDINRFSYIDQSARSGTSSSGRASTVFDLNLPKIDAEDGEAKPAEDGDDMYL